MGVAIQSCDQWVWLFSHVTGGCGSAVTCVCAWLQYMWSFFRYLRRHSWYSWYPLHKSQANNLIPPLPLSLYSLPPFPLHYQSNRPTLDCSSVDTDPDDPGECEVDDRVALSFFLGSVFVVSFALSRSTSNHQYIRSVM